jgi:outer membrane protein W
MKSLFTKTFAALSLWLVVNVSLAQEKVWSIGPEIGVNFSKFGMDANDNERITGVSAGIFLTYSVISTFGITGKILYSEKGAAIGAREEILKYIEVPITGRFFLNKEGKFRPNLFFGPSLGFLRSVYTKTGSADPVKVANYSDSYNTYDLGATGGLGLNYMILRETRLLLDARYTYGLTDLTKAPGQINNDAITVTFGLSFGI